MRILLLPALALILGHPAFANDPNQDWRYRSHGRPGAYRSHQDYNTFERRDNARFRHSRYDRPWLPEREVVVVRPEPPVIHVRPLPLPPPPPVGIHLWFGF